MSNLSCLRTCHVCGYQWPRGTSGSHACESYLTLEVESQAKRIRDLEALATVYDVTVALLVALDGGMDSLDPIARSQVEAARSACLEITASAVAFTWSSETTCDEVAPSSAALAALRSTANTEAGSRLRRKHLRTSFSDAPIPTTSGIQNTAVVVSRSAIVGEGGAWHHQFHRRHGAQA